MSVINFATVAALSVSLVALTAYPQVVAVTNTVSFSLSNPTQTQLSGVSFDYSFRSASLLFVNYTAAAFHCSPVLMHFYVDGIEKAVAGTFSANEQSGFIDLGPVTPGVHVLSLRAEGVAEGCNQGFLSGWGGSVDVVRAARACDFQWLDLQLSGTNFVIAWPNLPCNFVLESTTNQPSGIAWVEVPTVPVLADGWLTVTNDISDRNTFFRLRLDQ